MIAIQFFNRSGEYVGTGYVLKTAEVIEFVGRYYHLTAGRYVECNITYAATAEPGSMTGTTTPIVTTQVQMR
jgi:hypothetical protein